MRDTPRILVGTDLSARCDRAVERAFLLADQLGGSVTLVHVAGETPSPMVAEENPPQEKERTLKNYIRRDLGKRADRTDIIVVHGSVPAALATIAEETGADLIVTGVGRMNDIRDYFLGTAVDYLVRRAAIPVLVVKQRACGPYQRILVATDFSAPSRKAAEFAATTFPNAELHGVHAYHPAFEGFLDREESAGFVNEQAEGRLEKFMEKIPKELRDRFDIKLEEGELTGVIARQLQNLDSNLLVVGTHGRSGFARATIGSQAAELLQAEPTDILVVR